MTPSRTRTTAGACLRDTARNLAFIVGGWAVLSALADERGWVLIRTINQGLGL